MQRYVDVEKCVFCSKRHPPQKKGAKKPVWELFDALLVRKSGINKNE
jgi:hypothetical protein